MCHAHHLIHWADGGTTELDNLALLCGHHHRIIHHTPWEIRLNPTDRKPEFKPPPTLDTDPAWIRYRPDANSGEEVGTRRGTGVRVLVCAMPSRP